MSVVIRILLYVAAGNLMRGGWIPQDVADLISNNEELVHLIEAVAGAALTAGTILWWRIAKRMGWAT